MKLYSDWTVQLDSKDVEAPEKFKARLLQTKDVTDILKQILERKILAVRSKKEEYDKPSWAYFAADRNGYKRALEEIIKILP